MVVICALLVRAAFLWFAPENAVSSDLSINWTEVANQLERGGNPYNETTFLNWPPVWMQLLFVLRKVSTSVGLAWFRVVQLFTTGLDLLALTAALLVLTRQHKDATRALLYGWALNPSAVLIACQHCNFDGLVALWCVLAIGCLAQFERSLSVVDWLLGCLFVGLGIVTKTVPVVLTPLLIGAARGLDRKALALGGALVVGPVALGMSVIYVLGPGAITEHVLRYRSFAGWYGVTGLLYLFDAHSSADRYAKIFPILLALSLSLFTVLAWRRRLSAQALIASAGWLLLAIPTLGPGYGPQYVMWSLPFLALAWPFVSGASKFVLTAQLLVTALTLIVEYGLFPSHGALWLAVSESAKLTDWSNTLSTQRGQTLTRLPLFVVNLAWLGCGLRELWIRALREPSRLESSELTEDRR